MSEGFWVCTRQMRAADNTLFVMKQISFSRKQPSYPLEKVYTHAALVVLGLGLWYNAL
jgi:hypothetical protein